MRKIIQPKRLNKNISVQTYWQIRDKQKKEKKQAVFQAYRQDEVAKRFRYLKPTQQAKLFNPLGFFFKKSSQNTEEDQQYAKNFRNQQFTFVHQYLSSVRFRVSPPLIPIKKHIYGLKSIIYNHEAILTTLLKNLECEDSWPLVQGMLKDTKTQGFDYWMRQGLKKLAYQSVNQKGEEDSIYQLFFQQTRFQNLFDTLAIFMQANYDKIMQNMNEFFKIMNENFFCHKNKYVRKFSMKSVSYIINNLSLEENLNLIFHILLKGSIDLNRQKIPIGQLLLNRQKAVKGCLSSVQINRVVETLKQIPLFFIKNFQQSEMNNENITFQQQIKNQIEQILIVYITGILDMLETKFGRIDQGEGASEILFDLNFVIKAITTLQQKQDSHIKEIILIRAFSDYIQNSDQKRFLTHNPKHQRYIDETFKLILGYLKESTLRIIEKQNDSVEISTINQISRLLGLLFKVCPKQSSKESLSKGITHFTKLLTLQNSFQLVENIYSSQLSENLQKSHKQSLGEFILLSFSKFITAYFKNQKVSTEDQETQLNLLYTICQILKRIEFTSYVSLVYLNLDKTILMAKLNSVCHVSHFILYCRLIQLLNLEAQNDKMFVENFSTQIEIIFKKLVTPFSESLGQLIKINPHQQIQSNQIFSYNNHIRNLLKYSHHQVQWVSLAFNLQDCFKNVCKKINRKQNKQEKWIWSQLSLNRALKLDQSLTLQNIFSQKLNLLQSRNRLARKNILDRIIELWNVNSQNSESHKKIISVILAIDSDEIDLDNQRDIKKQFVLLELQTSHLKIENQLSQNIIKVLVNWTLGFCFTGFKLINQSIVSFFTSLLNLFPSLVGSILFPFIQYYIYRHSRQFQYDTTENPNFVLKTPNKVINLFNQVKNREFFFSLMKQDFSIQNSNTIQWIGLERVAQSIAQAKKFKNKNQNVKNILQTYLKKYFNEEFFRKQNYLSTYKSGIQTVNKYLIMQPKTRFLIVMLKLCPDTYLPPYQCLHYVASEYLGLQSVHNIKKNRWQALWVKKLKGSKSRQQITDTVSTSMVLDKMSHAEQQLYAHFLWKQIIESNQQKRRSIFEHIRDRVQDIIPYMFQKLIYGQMLFLKDSKRFFEEAQKNKQLVSELKQKFILQNKKTLLNFMYILKAMVVVFKHFLRNTDHIQNVVIITRALIQVVYSKSTSPNQIKDQEQHEVCNQGFNQKQDEQKEDEQIDDQNVQIEQKQQTKKGPFIAYKAHRKQLYKMITEIFTHHSLQYEQAQSLLSELSSEYLLQNNHKNGQDSKQRNVFSKVAYATVNSVPGILILLRIISNQSFYHHLLFKFGILDLAAGILDITEVQSEQIAAQHQRSIAQKTDTIPKKRQSNPHAIKQCLDILSNILGINQSSELEVKMQEENTQKSILQNLNSLKWKKSLENLLRSINHHFLYSKNMNQNTLQGKGGNIQLEYYSNVNKQNLSSIKNNKNRNKNEQNKYDTELKNLDLLWIVVSKIVNTKINNQEISSINLSQEWEPIFLSQINKVVKAKQVKDRQHYKLFNIIGIALIYFDQQIIHSKETSFSKKVDFQAFLCKIISVLPHIPQLSQRVKLTELIHKGISAVSKRQNLRLIDESAIKSVSLINAIKRNGLNIQIDYESFFNAITKYSEDNHTLQKSEQMIDESKIQLNLLSHQYIIYNLLPYITSQELSVRKAVKQALNSFLVKISVHLKQSETQTLKVFNSILRLLIEQLKKNDIDNVFWSIIGCIGLFLRFQTKFSTKFDKLFDNSILYNKMIHSIIRVDEHNKNLTFESESEVDFFHMITSISQGNKMKALRMLKQHCIKLKSEGDYQAFKQQQKGSCLPHPLSMLLPIIEHLVLPVKHFVNQHQYNIQGNLTSTLTLISLEVYENIMCFARQSLIKRQLKRLSTKIKFNQSEKVNSDSIKKNILVIKIISSIVQGIDSLEKCTGKIKKYVQQYGFDQFHSKLIQNARTLNQQAQQSDQQQVQDQKKKVQFMANLQELQSEEAINRNFMMFDRKLMEMQEKQNKSPNQSSQFALVKFLKLHILIPLKLMLFYQSKSNKKAKQQQDKSRMMLSVAITKLLIKFPMDTFLFEFQKILSKICRLMKKSKVQIRENGRKSLCQIAKIVGPEMLYAIVLELKFHLRDNFQKHIFNFTVYEIIQTLSPLKQGDIDYCLPLILPMVVDEMFGQASQQKKLVDANEVPVLNMETKKKKGHQLLILISRQISVDRIRYMIDYLQKFLKEYLNTQVNLSKYETMINHLMNGLGGNQEFLALQNAGVFGQLLCDSMYELRKEIKIYNFEEQKNKIVHQTTVKTNTQKIKKVGKQALLLQQQAGRNGSIFKKMSKQVYEKRNKQTMINCLVQFYLAMGSLLIKKQVLCLKSLQENKKLTQNFIKIVQFVFECMDHRDNRIVSKSMRLLHQALIWNYDKSTSVQLKQSIKSLRKKVSRKILLFIQKLTSTDQQLLKQSFVILIDLFSQVTITKQFLPSIIAIIKLHTNNENQDANIPEPYRLFKLIIYKVPQCIYDPIIYEMYEMIRINIVNSNIREIRDVCKSIASTYVKGKQFLQTGIELGNQQTNDHNKNSTKHNKNKNVEAQYSQKIKKQLNFYLSNLDCKSQQNQLLVLEIIEQCLSNRTKSQIQQISELVLLTLSTSVINGNEHIEKINKIASDVLKVIDKSKVYQILQKALVWISQPRQKAMIKQCGFLLLTSILSNKAVNIENHIVKSQYLFKNQSTSVLTSISTFLDQQVIIVEDYLNARRADNKSSKVQNKEWNNVLNAINAEQQNPFVQENRILQYCIEVLISLSESTEYQKKLKETHIISKVWALLRAPKNKICEKIITLLVKTSALSVHLQSQKAALQQVDTSKKEDQEQQQKGLTFNYKSTIAALINNNVSKQSITQLLKKMHSQQSTGQKVYLLSFNLLVSFLNKIVMKFKIMQSKTEHVYHLLNQTLLKDSVKNSLIFKSEQNINRIIDSLGKVSRNQFVTLQVKTLNQQSMNYIKQVIGVTDFYKKLTKLQSERRQKKSEQKAQIARLAVTDQKAYYDQKKKKIKTEN